MHKVPTFPAIDQAQDRESSPIEDQHSTIVLCRQNIKWRDKNDTNFSLLIFFSMN